LTPPEEARSTQWTEGRVEVRGGLDAVAKTKTRDLAGDGTPVVQSLY